VLGVWARPSYRPSASVEYSCTPATTPSGRPSPDPARTCRVRQGHAPGPRRGPERRPRKVSRRLRGPAHPRDHHEQLRPATEARRLPPARRRHPARVLDTLDAQTEDPGPLKLARPLRERS